MNTEATQREGDAASHAGRTRQRQRQELERCADKPRKATGGRRPARARKGRGGRDPFSRTGRGRLTLLMS